MVGPQIADFTRRVAINDQEQVCPTPALLDVHPESFVLLLIQELVWRATAGHVAPQLIRPFSDVVFCYVEECPVISSPCNARHPLYSEGARSTYWGLVGVRVISCSLGAPQPSGAQIFHFQRVLPISRGIGGVGQQLVVFAYLQYPQPHEGVPRGHLIQVEEYFLF